MACRLACVCAVFVCLLWYSQAAIHTETTKSLIGMYPHLHKSIKLPNMYIRDAQCNGYIGPEAFDECKFVVSSVTVLATDKMPPDVNIGLNFALIPQWEVKIYRTSLDCAGEANVTATITCVDIIL